MLESGSGRSEASALLMVVIEVVLLQVGDVVAEGLML